MSFTTTGLHYSALFLKSYLGVISANPINLDRSDGTLDFTQDIGIAQGIQQQKNLNGKPVLFSGDFDGNGIINNLDYNRWISDNSAVNQYLFWVEDGNDVINNVDYNLWRVNRSKVGDISIHFP